MREPQRVCECGEPVYGAERICDGCWQLLHEAELLADEHEADQVERAGHLRSA